MSTFPTAGIRGLICEWQDAAATCECSHILRIFHLMCSANPNVVMVTTKHGGHLAFFEGFTAQALWYPLFSENGSLIRNVSFLASTLIFCHVFDWHHSESVSDLRERAFLISNLQLVLFISICSKVFFLCRWTRALIEFMTILIPSDLMHTQQKVGLWRASEVLADENGFGDREKIITPW